MMGQIKDFLLADIGEGIAEVEVLEWSVKPGAKVEEFDELLKVQSDKAATEITSPYEGTVVELMVEVGDMAKVGKPLCRIEVEGEAEAEASADASPTDAGETTAKGTDSATESAPSSSVDTDFKSGKVLTSPAVRRLAKEKNVDLMMIAGSGPKGRILKEDVLKFLSGAAPAQTASPTPPTKATPKATSTPTSAPGSTQATIARPSMPARSAEDQEVPVRGLDRIMVQTMQAAHTVPTLLYSDEFSVNSLVRTRTQCKPHAESLGVKLTYLPFIIKSASMALLEYPKLNSHVNEDCTSFVMKGAHNIGVAVQTPAGLIVPNVKNVQDKSIIEIAADLGDLQALGQAGKLTKDQLTGGTFTISNIGTIGGTVCKPLIVVPEVAIAALGKFQAVPRFDNNDNIYKDTIMNVSLSADHRIIDGATVASFSNLWKQYLEHPETMMIHCK